MHFTGLSRRLVPAAAIAVLALSLVLAACGGGDDSKPASDSGATTTTANATQQPGAATGTAPAQPAPSGDVAYMKAICTAANDSLNPVVDKVSKDPSLLTDQKKLIDAMTPALSDLSGKLDKIDPPNDLKDYHGQLIQRFNDVIAKAKAGQLQSVVDIANASEGIQPSPELKARLENAANQTPECQESLLFGSGVFGR